jgi:two-component system, OmpR family, phosphate regulon sensor histidine kinase PhoR
MTLKAPPKSADIASGRLERQRLTSLVNSMADAVIAVDQEAKIVLYNGAALNIFDVNTIRTGDALADLFCPLDQNSQPFDIASLIKKARVPTTNRDLRLQYADGSLINLYVSIAPVHLGYGEQGHSGYVLLLRDITREKSLEEERDEFISVTSHELRTPVTIAEGNLSNAQFLAEKSHDLPAIKEALRVAHDQVLFLADMINDLSTLSRAERNQLHVAIEPINVHDLLADLAGSYQAEAAAKGLKLTFAVDPTLATHGLVHSSQLYVREILQNFITNAIKYTAKGRISLRATADPKAKGVRFAVHDTGIGIGKADQERVFDKFFRSEDYRTRESSGTGLGLYVTMKLAHMLHATIDLDSELNKGSTFTILIPDLDKSN